MLRDMLNRIFSSRVFYIIFSLLVSIALWMYVEISENQDIPREVQNVRIEFRNKDLLSDKGLLIASFVPQNVTLSFECPRAIASRLTRDTLSVVVDLAKITSTGPAPLTYDIVYPPGVDSNSIREFRDVERITLIIDRVRDRSIQVRADYSGGTSSDELIAEPAAVEPKTIIVSGPEEVVSKISYAFVPIEIINLSSTYTDDLKFVLYNENDEELSEDLLSSLKFNYDTVRVTVPVRQIKNIPLTVELKHGAGSSNQNTKVTCEPLFITVSGDPEVLRNFNSITLGTIFTTEFGFTREDSFPIILLNDYVTNLSGETMARVRVDVVGLDVDILVTSNFHLINLPAEYEYELITQSLDVRLRGLREDLVQITQANIRVVADFRDRDIRPGSMRVPATVYIDGTDADIGAVGDYMIAVRLSLKES